MSQPTEDVVNSQAVDLDTTTCSTTSNHEDVAVSSASISGPPEIAVADGPTLNLEREVSSQGDKTTSTSLCSQNDVGQSKTEINSSETRLPSVTSPDAVCAQTGPMTSADNERLMANSFLRQELETNCSLSAASDSSRGEIACHDAPEVVTVTEDPYQCNIDEFSLLSAQELRQLVDCLFPSSNSTQPEEYASSEGATFGQNTNTDESLLKGDTDVMHSDVTHNHNAAGCGAEGNRETDLEVATYKSSPVVNLSNFPTNRTPSLNSSEQLNLEEKTTFIQSPTPPVTSDELTAISDVTVTFVQAPSTQSLSYSVEQRTASGADSADSVPQSNTEAAQLHTERDDQSTIDNDETMVSKHNEQTTKNNDINNGEDQNDIIAHESSEITMTPVKDNLVTGEDSVAIKHQSVGKAAAADKTETSLVCSADEEVDTETETEEIENVNQLSRYQRIAVLMKLQKEIATMQLEMMKLRESMRSADNLLQQLMDSEFCNDA